MNKKNYFPG